MSADWSALRRRQTLAEVQNHHGAAAGASQIPMPSSVFKKSTGMAGRASVAPGALPPPRSSLAPQRFSRSSSVAGGNLADNGTQQQESLRSSKTASQRESLRSSRQSYAPKQSLYFILPLQLC